MTKQSTMLLLVRLDTCCWTAEGADSISMDTDGQERENYLCPHISANDVSA